MPTLILPRFLQPAAPRPGAWATGLAPVLARAARAAAAPAQQPQPAAKPKPMTKPKAAPLSAAARALRQRARGLRLRAWHHASRKSWFISQYPSRSNPREDQRVQNANCGPTSVAMVARAFGRLKITSKQADNAIEAVRKRGDMGRDQTDGTAIFQLARAARSYGLEAVAKPSPDLAAINAELQAGRLVIAHVVPRYLWPSTDTGHWTVVTAIKHGRVYLNDPANPAGPMSVDAAAFMAAIARRGTYRMLSVGEAPAR